MTDKTLGGLVPEAWPFVGRVEELRTAHAMLAAPHSRGLVVYGPAGVGRSRFAAEVLAQSGGGRFIRAVTAFNTPRVPLGAVTSLVPNEPVTDAGLAVSAVRRLRRARTQITADGPVLLVIDDAHLLDPLSLTLLQQLINDEQVQVMITVRAGDIVPDALSALWRTERLDRIDLTPLNLASVSALLHLALAGPVDGRAIHLLHETSEGVPLALREIVRTARALGTLAPVDGVWRVWGTLAPVRHAVDSASELLSHLDAESRHLLELLELAGETPLELVDRVATTVTLERLDVEGLVTVRPGAVPGTGYTVAISRPAVSDAVRSDLTLLRTRTILRSHAYAYERWSTGGPEDALRVAGWRLTAGIPAESDELERMATLARQSEDLESTVRFAEAADRAGGSLRSAVLWVDALYRLCRWSECEEVAARTIDRPGEVADRLRLMGMRCTNLLLGLLRGSDGLALMGGALVAFDAGRPEWCDGLDAAGLAKVREELVNRVAELQLQCGEPATALATLDPRPAAVPSGNDDGPGVRDALYSRVLWAIPGVQAIALSGRTGEAVALGFEAFADHERLGGEVASATSGTHLLTVGLALQEHGDFEKARSLSLLGYNATLERGILVGQIWFGMTLARIGLLNGHPATVVRWAREVLAATSVAGWLGPRLMVLHGLAAANALLGDLDGARQCLVEAESIGGEFRYLFPERVLGPAYIAAAEGRFDDARIGLLAGAEIARTSGHLTIESWLRYEAIRLGAPHESARLQELAEKSDSPLVKARARYAHAVAVNDATLLEQSGAEFEKLGCDMAASELFAASADVLHQQGFVRAASAANLRALAAAARCEGSRSFGTARPDIAIPLTAREREIVGLAASGVPSKEIAKRLDVSVRTVSNHLQNAYKKLGVSARADVALALGISR